MFYHHEEHEEHKEIIKALILIPACRGQVRVLRGLILFFIILTGSKTAVYSRVKYIFWSGREDLNLRPLEPHSSALPDCATPRQILFIIL